MDLEIFRMHRLGLPQERIAKKLGAIQRTVSKHLEKMPALAIVLNTDLSKGFTVSQVAEKHNIIKGDALNFLRILFCQLIIVLTINYLVHFQKVSEQGGTNSKTPD